MQALIIVDIQNDFLPGGNLPVMHGDEVIPVINKLLDLDFDLKIATKDWHPPKHESFASTHNMRAGESIMLHGLKQTLWPDHCVQNTPGAEFPKELNTLKFDKIFYKGSNVTIDSYSAFFDNAHNQSTGLGEYLAEHQVDTVYIAGLATDYCVKYSVLDALALNLRVFIIPEACRGVNLHPEDSEKALQKLISRGAQLLPSIDKLKLNKEDNSTN